MKKLNTFIILVFLSAGLFAKEQDTDKKLSSWRKISEPSIKPRSGHSAIWTGKEMIIWGGISDTKCLGDGAVFDMTSIDK